MDKFMEIKNLEYVYSGGNTALKGISVDIYKGKTQKKHMPCWQGVWKHSPPMWRRRNTALVGKCALLCWDLRCRKNPQGKERMHNGLHVREAGKRM